MIPQHVVLVSALAVGATSCADDVPDCGSGPRTDVEATSVIDLDTAMSYANFVQDDVYQGQMTLNGAVYVDGPPCATFPCAFGGKVSGTRSTHYPARSPSRSRDRRPPYNPSPLSSSARHEHPVSIAAE